MYLVTGSAGQLGNELKLILGEKAVYVDREELDICDEKAVSDFFAKNKFEAIINCAAYTAVDKAESDFDNALKVNSVGPSNLAKTGVPLVHISTDYVFDGSNFKPYVEEDKTSPTSVYGDTKLKGEQAVFEKASDVFVIRTSWLYSTFGNNFVKTMLKYGKERGELNVIFDQVGTPTYAADLAQAIVEMLPLIKGKKELYHFSNEGVCSWYDFAKAIMELSGIECKVNPIESKDYPTPVKRPFYSVLNKAKIKKDFGLAIPHWRDGLKKMLKNMEG